MKGKQQVLANTAKGFDLVQLPKGLATHLQMSLT